MFLKEHSDIEIIVKTLDDDGHWKEDIDPVNGTLKIVVSAVNKEPKNLTEFFVQRIGETSLNLVGSLGGVKDINDLVVFGFERAVGEVVDFEKVIGSISDAADIINLKDKVKELKDFDLSKHKKVRKIYNKLFNEKVIVRITNYLSPTKERSADSVVNTGFSRMKFSDLSAFIYAVKKK